MASVQVDHASAKKVQGTRTLLAIALFKLVKAASLIALGIGALRLLHHDVETTVMGWIEDLHVDPDNHFIHGLLTRVLAISPAELKAASVGTFLYAALLLTEGIGLLFRKPWAEYLTIIATSLLIPLELYELSLEVSVAKLWVLVVNIAIVAYLVWLVRRSRHAVHG
jgi:uncharacterized membrane protein (DUF2068 family)